MARQQPRDWSAKKKKRRAKSNSQRSRRPNFETLETRTMLSVSPGLASELQAPAADTAADSDQAEHQEHHVLTVDDWRGNFYVPPPAAATSGPVPDHADVLTIILDFIEPGQENGIDGFDNVVTTFDVTTFGFAQEDYDLVTEAVLEEVRSDYYDIATDDVFPLSAVPAGMELHVEFEIGDQGTPPINGSTDYYYMQIGSFVSGTCAGALGCAGLSFIRDSAGDPGFVEVGTVVGSVFSDGIQGLGGLSPGNALSSGDFEFTANALGGTTSHEIGHAVSLDHLAKAGSVTPNNASPIMGTGAIDTPNQDRIEAREFAYSGFNPEQGGQEQFHITQLVSALGLTEAGSGPRGGIKVDTLSDENDGDFSDGDLSLREAIELATAGGRRRKVEFDDILAGGTILLDSDLGSLLVAGPTIIEGLLGEDRITIQAPAPNGGIAAHDDGQIFVIQYGPDAEFSTANVEMSGLILTGASSVSDGGAIYSEHELMLTDFDVNNNTTTGDGGAVYTTAKLDIFTSSVVDNQATGDGGAIYTEGGVRADFSTVANNISGDEGGAFAIRGLGTRIELSSSTISGNQAVGDGGGLHVEDSNPAKFLAAHSTIFGNTSTAGSGGGVYMYNGVFVLDHTIIAGNSDMLGEAPDINNVNLLAIPAVLSKYSLIGNDEGSAITELEPSLIGNITSPIDPMLDTLKDNGGPTMTNEPVPGSPAIDGGNVIIPLPPEFDQRGPGFDRIGFGVIDIGAVETSGFAFTFTVDTLSDEDDGDLSAGDLSLREAIQLSSNEPGRDKILFNPSLIGGTITLDATLGELLIDAPMEIDASGLPAGLTIDASAVDPTPLTNNGDGSRVFRIDDGNTAIDTEVAILGIEITGGDVTGDGGGIYSLENLTLRFVSVSDNAATHDGGGIFHQNAPLVIEDSTVSGNYAVADGGGLHSNTSMNDPETGRISQATFSGNMAGDEGGGIFNIDGLLDIRQSTITLNGANLAGGVVSFADPFTKTIVSNTIIAGNTGFDVQRSSPSLPNSVTFESGLYNLIGSGNALSAFQQDPSDLTEVADPLLGPLANNGGKTLTHRPLPGSLAIENGNPILTGRKYADEVLANSPALYWKLDEESGSEVVDTIGNSNGSVGAGVTLNRPGAAVQTANAVLFTGGANNFIQNVSPALGTSSFGDNYSISLWFNASSSGLQQTVFAFVEDGTNTHQVSLELIPDGGINFTASSGSLQATATFAGSEWHNVVVVQEGTETRLYIDGQLDSTATLADATLDVDTLLSLGQGDGGTDPFSGVLDEFILYDSSLSDVDVGALYFTATNPQQPLVDQRGSTFARVLDGDDNGEAVIDIGALEAPVPKPDPDFNNDNNVDGFDFLTWQRGFGTTSGASATDGDSDDDGDVDGTDLFNWNDAYGFVAPTPSVAEDIVSAPISQPTNVTSTLSTHVSTNILSKSFSNASNNASDDRLAAIAARTQLFNAWGEDRLNERLDFGMTPPVLFDIDSLSLDQTDSNNVRQSEQALKKRRVRDVGSTPSSDRVFDLALDLALARLEDSGLRNLGRFRS